MAGELSIKELSKFHDAEINSILRFSEENDLQLGFKLNSGGQCTVIFHDVKAVRIRDLVSQNVVSRVKVLPFSSLSDARVEELINWANSFVDADIRLAPNAMQHWLTQIKNGRWILFVIEPSRGAEVVVIAETITLDWSR
jgi:hypothetical protein